MKKLIMVVLASMLLMPTAQAGGWDIGFHIETVNRTNVVVKWRLTCTNGGIAIPAKGKFEAQAPLTRQLQPTIAGADSCHLVVRVWDVPPHTRPHNWPAPQVTTWVRP